MVSYGLQIEPQFGFDFKQIKEMVQLAEKSKFSHAWFSDHFMLSADATDVLAYECFTSMMAAVSYTESLRIGALVFCNNYRHPTVLAKQFASLDHYSGGRVEFGYGAGWKEVEYKQYGIEFPSTGTRLKQMVEGIKVIRNLWTQERANFKGDFYELNDAVSFPKPFQQPHPPIWVGTMYARPKMLNIAAKYADGINLAWAYTEEVFAEKMQELDVLCEKYDRKPSSLRRSYGVWTRIFESEEEKKKVWKEIAEKRGVSLAEAEIRFQNYMHGTIEEIIERLRAYAKLGVEQFIFMFPESKEIEQLNIMAQEVLPKL